MPWPLRLTAPTRRHSGQQLAIACRSLAPGRLGLNPSCCNPASAMILSISFARIVYADSRNTLSWQTMRIICELCDKTTYIPWSLGCGPGFWDAKCEHNMTVIWWHYEMDTTIIWKRTNQIHFIRDWGVFLSVSHLAARDSASHISYYHHCPQVHMIFWFVYVAWDPWPRGESLEVTELTRIPSP